MTSSFELLSIGSEFSNRPPNHDPSLSHDTLFLGDLAMLATEETLRNLFTPYGEIAEIRVKCATDSQKRLGYGFIRYHQHEAAAHALEALNGYMLKGRVLRMHWAKNVRPGAGRQKADNYKPQTAQVLASFISRSVKALVTEEVLRQVFSRFGEVVDATVKKSQLNPESNLQTGYGFVHYADSPEGIRSALLAIDEVRNVIIDDVAYDCRMSDSLRTRLASGGNGGGSLSARNVISDESRGILTSPQAPCITPEPLQYVHNNSVHYGVRYAAQRESASASSHIHGNQSTSVRQDHYNRAVEFTTGLTASDSRHAPSYNSSGLGFSQLPYSTGQQSFSSTPTFNASTYNYRGQDLPPQVPSNHRNSFPHQSMVGPEYGINHDSGANRGGVKQYPGGGNYQAHFNALPINLSADSTVDDDDLSSWSNAGRAAAVGRSAVVSQQQRPPVANPAENRSFHTSTAPPRNQFESRMQFSSGPNSTAGMHAYSSSTSYNTAGPSSQFQTSRLHSSYGMRSMPSGNAYDAQYSQYQQKDDGLRSPRAAEFPNNESALSSKMPYQGNLRPVPHSDYLNDPYAPPLNRPSSFRLAEAATTSATTITSNDLSLSVAEGSYAHDPQLLNFHNKSFGNYREDTSSRQLVNHSQDWTSHDSQQRLNLPPPGNSINDRLSHEDACGIIFRDLSL